VKKTVVIPIPSRMAARVVIQHHYLHRRPPISHAFGLLIGADVVGVVTFGTPPSRHLQMSACPSNPAAVIELNRLWVSDEMPRNTESWFVSRALAMLPPLIVVSYADTERGHVGYIYRALNFFYAGWTDMERKTPRYDYVPTPELSTDAGLLFPPSEIKGKHSRDAMRCGEYTRVRRKPKLKYWTATGNRRDRRGLVAACGWPRLDWRPAP
jgi:hypothetical protein